MRIIGHRGSHGTHYENTTASLREAIKAGADMIEIDVRLTKDRVPVLSHDLRLFGTKKRELALLRRYTFGELQKRTSKTEHPILSLDEAFGICFGEVDLNVEIKELTAVTPTLAVINSYAKEPSDWNRILISAFNPFILMAVRRRARHASLGLLHHRNPFVFVGWHKLLKLSAVGFYVNVTGNHALRIAKSMGLFTYVYTVNERDTALRLKDSGIDAIVTDYPERLRGQLDNRSS